jgi:uncharacterized protein (TIGR03083 family)
MERDEVWRTVERSRLALADLLDGLAPDEWEQPSLCAGWRVREVAAHLTLAPQFALLDGAAAVIRAGGRFHRMIDQTARRKAAQPTATLVAELRAHAGSRRLPPGTNHLNTLFDVLVHSQDIAVPLGRPLPMPPDAARVAAERVWTMGWPFQARRRLAAFRLSATDVAWTRASGASADITGALIEGPIEALLLLLTGRAAAALPRLRGAGADRLARSP